MLRENTERWNFFQDFNICRYIFQVDADLDMDGDADANGVAITLLH